MTPVELKKMIVAYLREQVSLKATLAAVDECFESQHDGKPIVKCSGGYNNEIKINNMNTYFLEERFIRKIDKEYSYEAKKTALIAVINMMDERDCEKLYMEINELVQFRDANVGKWAFDKKQEPCSLLHRFWQRSSDACPLEANEAEKQENEFNDWVCEQYEQLSFPI